MKKRGKKSNKYVPVVLFVFALLILIVILGVSTVNKKNDADQIKKQNDYPVNEQINSPSDEASLNQLRSRGVPGTVPVYQLFGSSSAVIYTIHPSIRDQYSAAGWTNTGIAFWVYSYQVTGTTPVYQLMKRNNFIYTIYTSIRDQYVSSGWTNTGIAFYVYSSQVSGTIPVYQLFGPSGAVAYTIHPSIRDQYIGLGWTYTGISFYVYPETWNPNERQISNINGGAWVPSIYENRIVYSGSIDGKKSNIYMYDLSTNSERRITNIIPKAPRIYTHTISPEIYGNRIVWIDDRTDGFEVYMFDLSTNIEKRITPNLSLPYGRPYQPSRVSIYGNRIVYDDSRNGFPEIYLYDLTTNKETRLTYSTSQNLLSMMPMIYGDKIVYEKKSYIVNSGGTYWNSDGDIYVYDTTTNTEKRITIDSIPDGDPSIYNNKIIWAKGDFNADIYLYDLTTNVQTKITDNPYPQVKPVMYDNKIVWMDRRSGNYVIYAYDLITKKETRLTEQNYPYPWNQGNPAIYGNKVVFDDTRSGNGQIMSFT